MKKLTTAQYGSYAIWDRGRQIQELVNKEAEYFHANDPRPEIPKFEIPKVKRSVGLWNLMRQVLP